MNEQAIINPDRLHMRKHTENENVCIISCLIII